MKITPRRIAFAGILAALYAALTIATSSFAYGPVQFRLAEAFAVLCCFTPAAIPGMVLGCMAANLASFVSPWDFAIGTAATLLACLFTWFMTRTLRAEQPGDDRTPASVQPTEQQAPRRRALPRLALIFLVPLPTILFNAVIVGAEIAWFFDDRAFWTAYAANAFSVGIGEAAVMYVLGVPLLIWLLRNKRLELRAV